VSNESPGLAEIADLISEALEGELASAVKLREQIHQQPEVSWHEYETAASIRESLESLTVEPFAEPGFVCRVGGADLPTVGIRAELDGLPVVEATGVPFASTNGSMHACGHDVHMAALVALMRAVDKVNLARPIPVALLGIFQPSEEANPSGAKRMIESNRLADHNLYAMLGLHVHPGISWGTVTTGEGIVNACADSFVVTVTGSGGHGAYPHLSRDPVLALSHVVVALQQIVSRRTDPMNPTVLSVTRLQAGLSSNVIPSEAVAEGTVRTFVPGDRAEVLALLESVSTNTASAYGCQARVEVADGEPALLNDPELLTAVNPWLASVGLSVAEPFRSCGADDFSFYRDVCPILMMFLGVQGHCGRVVANGQDVGSDHGSLELNESPGLHNAAFLPESDTVGRAAHALLAAFIGASQQILEGRSART
jgi:amidohydrolase